MKIAEMIKLGAKGFKPSDIRELGASGMSTDDVIKLAENGYSVADVRELINLAGSEETVQPGNEEPTERQGPAALSGYTGEDQDDYKEKLKAQEDELARLRRSLETLQQENSRRNLGGAEPKPNREKVQDIFRQLY